MTLKSRGPPEHGVNNPFPQYNTGKRGGGINGNMREGFRDSGFIYIVAMVRDSGFMYIVAMVRDSGFILLQCFGIQVLYCYGSGGLQ